MSFFYPSSEVSIYRSEIMEYLKLLIPKDNIYNILHIVGELECIHIVDLNGENSSSNISSSSNIIYNDNKKYMISAYNLEKRLLLLEEKAKEYKIEIDVFNENLLLEPMSNRNIYELFIEGNEWIDANESRYLFLLYFLKDNAKNANLLKEEKIALKFTIDEKNNFSDIQESIESNNDRRNSDELFLTSSSSSTSDSALLKATCGVIPDNKIPDLERMIWRSSRGTAVVKFSDELVDCLDKDTPNVIVQKRAFNVHYLGNNMQKKLSGIIASNSGTEYDVSKTGDRLESRIKALDRELTDKANIAHTTREDIIALLKSIVHPSSAYNYRAPLRYWQVIVRKELAICDAIKKTSMAGDFVRLEGWCPSMHVQKVNTVFTDECSRLGIRGICQRIPFDPLETPPPTYFQTNSFTSAFQGIVDTYGVPKYREVNPGLFTIITFPFLFGVMYGDIGHSIFLFAFALYMIINEESLEKEKKSGKINEMIGMMFGGRYMLLLMGLFAFYCGWIYNDCMSISLDAFGTNYYYPFNTTSAAKYNSDSVYPFGVDPVWAQSSADLSFYNSLKMKMSVSVGVIHMTFGVILSLSNKLYFKDYLGVFFEFIPQMIFLVGLFGYMIAMIIIKWSIDWSLYPGLQPPNLIQTMMNMFLNMGVVPENEQMFAGQATLQTAIVLLALMSVPVMLFVKPLVLLLVYNNPDRRPESDNDEVHLALLSSSTASYHTVSVEDEDDHISPRNVHGHDEHKEEEEGFGEMMIHQSIHTIEFVLGTVSNTASYLRLWALSLAHSELAKVFWDKLMMMGVKSGNPFLILCCFAAWAAITTAVLLMMDVLECFLHALRLHWVEFQNKFFEASGYAFKPYTLKFAVLDKDN